MRPITTTIIALALLTGCDEPPATNDPEECLALMGDDDGRLWAFELDWTAEAQSLSPGDIDNAAAAGLRDAAELEPACWDHEGGSLCALRVSNCNTLLAAPIDELDLDPHCAIEGGPWAIAGSDEVGQCYGTFDGVVAFRLR